MDGPYFDDLRTGETLSPAPPITIGPGETALYQAICGDPLALALSAPVAESITGAPGSVVNPALVLHMSIGQSTVATRRVIANLFYRGVAIDGCVRVGDTLSTSVTIDGLRETTRREGKPPRGLALLGITTVDQTGRTVTAFQRCALMPFRDDTIETGRADDLGPSDTPLDLAAWVVRAPQGWNLAILGAADDWAVGQERPDVMRDTVTDALALVRLTQNQAAVHRDPALHATRRRLVYGGHTIGLAQASLGRLMPSMATIIGWHSCDHTGPVFEDDILDFRATLTAEQALSTGRLLAMNVLVRAERGGELHDVLDWKPVVYAP